MTNDQVDRMIADQNRQIAEVWALFRETREQMAETDKKIVQTGEQLAQLKGTVEQTSKTVAQVSRNLGDLSNRWGRFIEYFLAPGVARIFQERGIAIYQTHERVKATIGGQRMEIDLMGVDTEYVVAIEVKSNLKVEDVDAHLGQLEKFKTFFSSYADRKLVGAVAGIEISSEADKYAERKGLFVIGQSGETVQILNSKEFKPKMW